MQNIKNMGKFISDGYVLNKNGAWVPIDSAVADEKEMLFHVEHGEVFRDGKWMTMEEVMVCEGTPAIIESDDSSAETLSSTAEQIEDTIDMRDSENTQEESDRAPVTNGANYAADIPRIPEDTHCGDNHEQSGDSSSILKLFRMIQNDKIQVHDTIDEKIEMLMPRQESQDEIPEVKNDGRAKNPATNGDDTRIETIANQSSDRSVTDGTEPSADFVSSPVSPFGFDHDDDVARTQIFDMKSLQHLSVKTPTPEENEVAEVEVSIPQPVSKQKKKRSESSKIAQRPLDFDPSVLTGITKSSRNTIILFISGLITVLAAFTALFILLFQESIFPY